MTTEEADSALTADSDPSIVPDTIPIRFEPSSGFMKQLKEEMEKCPAGSEKHELLQAIKESQPDDPIKQCYKTQRQPFGSPPGLFLLRIR